MNDIATRRRIGQGREAARSRLGRRSLLLLLALSACFDADGLPSSLDTGATSETTGGPTADADSTAANPPTTTSPSDETSEGPAAPCTPGVFDDAVFDDACFG